VNGFRVSSDPVDLDIDLIHNFIANSYWAKGIPLATLKKAVSNSIVFGVFSYDSEQVGVGQVIIDKATFAYLDEGFIIDNFQGLGISKLLMQAVCSHPELQGLRRFMLATKDAHGLYAQFGFEALEHPEPLMQIWQPNIYQTD